MHKKITEFLDEVCSHIKFKEIHKDIREELSEHINGLTEENIVNGCDDERALDLAISAMGSTGEIGIKLNRQHKPQTEWSLLILTAFITVIGGIALFSGGRLAGDQTIVFSRYLMFLLVGIGVMTVFYFFDYTKLKKMVIPLYLSGVLLILLTMAAGIQMNGVKRWLAIGSYTISVPELASLLFLIAFAGLLEQYRGQGIGGAIRLILLGAFSVFLLILMPCLAAAFIMMITYAVLLTVAAIRKHFGGSRKSQLLLLLTCGAVPVIWLVYQIISNPYILKRLRIFFPGEEIDPLGSYYHQYMANTWLSASNWLGKANAYQGHGLDMMPLPGITGEYILVNIIATFGWAVGMLLILLIGIFVVRMFLTVKKVKNGYGFYLSLAGCTMLSAQFLSNILLNFNLLPLMGINMPLVSYGGTGYVVCMAFVGMILSVWRKNNLMLHNQQDVLNVSSQKSIVSFADGKLTIDLKAWRNQ